MAAKQIKKQILKEIQTEFDNLPLSLRIRDLNKKQLFTLWYDVLMHYSSVLANRKLAYIPEKNRSPVKFVESIRDCGLFDDFKDGFKDKTVKQIN